MEKIIKKSVRITEEELKMIEELKEMYKDIHMLEINDSNLFRLAIRRLYEDDVKNQR